MVFLSVAWVRIRNLSRNDLRVLELASFVWQLFIPTLTRPSDGDLHGQIEEVGVSVTHAVLVEERRHHLAARRLVSNAERLVFDWGAQTSGVHLDGRLQAEEPAAVAMLFRLASTCDTFHHIRGYTRHVFTNIQTSGCQDVSGGEQLLTFRTTFLPKLGNCLPIDTAWHPRLCESSVTPLRKPQTSHPVSPSHLSSTTFMLMRMNKTHIRQGPTIKRTLNRNKTGDVCVT